MNQLAICSKLFSYENQFLNHIHESHRFYMGMYVGFVTSLVGFAHFKITSTAASALSWLLPQISPLVYTKLRSLICSNNHSQLANFNEQRIRDFIMDSPLGLNIIVKELKGFENSTARSGRLILKKMQQVLTEINSLVANKTVKIKK